MFLGQGQPRILHTQALNSSFHCARVHLGAAADQTKFLHRANEIHQMQVTPGPGEHLLFESLGLLTHLGRNLLLRIEG